MGCMFKHYQEELIECLEKRSTKALAAFGDKWSSQGLLDKAIVNHYKANPPAMQKIGLCHAIVESKGKVSEETYEWAKSYLQQNGYWLPN